MKITLRIFGSIGVLLFLPLFLMTFADPQLIENAGRAFIEWKLEGEVRDKVDAIRLPAQQRFEKLLGQKAAALRSEAEQKLAVIRQQLNDDLPAILAEQIARARNLDCECRRKWEERLRTSMQLQIVSLEAARDRVIDFTQAKYVEIVHKLTLDVRIFLGANSLVFLFLLLVSFLKPQAVRHLFLPGVLMFASTLVCSYFYLFEQNWFYTILYNDYTGLAYVGYLLLVFALLCDIVFNRARVTTEILNAILQAIGQVGNLAPC